MKRWIILVILSLVSSIPNAVEFYISSSIGQSTASDTVSAPKAQFEELAYGLFWPSNGLSLNGFEFDDNSQSWSASLGVSLNHHLAFELGYFDYGSIDGSFSNIELTSSEWFLSSRFSYPIFRKFEIIGELGITKTKFDASGDVFFGIQDEQGGIPFFAKSFITDIEDENETIIGAGFGLPINKKISFSLMYYERDVEVIKYKSTMLAASYSF